MISIRTAKGAVFDVDETLLDNNERVPELALHARARLDALHEAGKRHNIPLLTAITPLESFNGFRNAPTHSLEGAVWHILHTSGIVDVPEIDRQHPLLREIVTDKDAAYEILLRNEGRPFPGAVEFVNWVAGHSLPLAVASTAIRHDIDIFFEMANLDGHFPSERIISFNDVTYAKPHPEAFEKAFQTLGLPDADRSHVLAFEDNPRGIASAKAAGLFVCAITNAYPREHLMAQPVPPDLVADSFDEFRELLS